MKSARAEPRFKDRKPTNIPNVFYIKTAKRDLQFLQDEEGGWFDEFGQYFNKDAVRSDPPVQRYIKLPEQNRFNSSYILSNDGQGFWLDGKPGCIDFFFTFDKQGGWYDEYGNYFDKNGVFILQKRANNQNKKQRDSYQKKVEQVNRPQQQQLGTSRSNNWGQREAKNNNNNQQIDREEYIKRLLQDNRIQDTAAQQSIIKRLQEIFKEIGLDSQCFGSFVNGTGSRSSDIDFTVLTKDFYLEDERKLIASLQLTLTEKLQPQTEYEIITLVRESVRVPLLVITWKAAQSKQGTQKNRRKRDSKTNKKAPEIRIEISVNNRLGVINSELLSCYMSLHKNVRDLGLLAKIWAQNAKISSKHRLTSYALILMVIYFLQRRGYLPSLQALNHTPEKAQVEKIRRVVRGKYEEFKTDFWFERDLNEAQKYTNLQGLQDSKISQLFTEFLQFYGDEYTKNKLKIDITRAVSAEPLRANDQNVTFDIVDPFDLLASPGERPYTNFERYFVRQEFQIAFEQFSEQKKVQNSSNEENQSNKSEDSESDDNRQKQLGNQNWQKVFKSARAVHYKRHLKKQQMDVCLQEKTLFLGKFIGLENNINRAYIECEELAAQNKKVIVADRTSMNRALHGDIVAFALVERPKKDIRLVPLQDKEQEKQENDEEKQENNYEEEEEKLEDEEYKQDNDEQQEQDSEEEEEQKQDSLQAKKNKDNDDQIRQDINEGEEEADEEQIDYVYAEVAGIYQNKWKNRSIVGHLVSSQKNPKQHFLVPVNKRLPHFFAIQKRKKLDKKVQKDGAKKPELNIQRDKESCFFSGKIQKWFDTDRSPAIVLTENCGRLDNIELNCEIILDKNDVFIEDFGANVKLEIAQLEKQLDEHGEYRIPAEERAKRLDLTNELICSIDPSTARDIDDALSVKALEENGIFEVGVHIADVSHFVQEGSSLDNEATLRTTSVYLVHKMYPMLPPLLSENLCSLNAAVERLAFSIFFYIREDGEVLYERGARYGKSVIRSCAKLSYDTVQSVFDGKLTDAKEFPESAKFDSEHYDGKKLLQNLQILRQLGLQRRQKRLAGGALAIEEQKKKFTLDENLQPIDYEIYVRNEAMFVVEEFMLLANEFAAKKLVSACEEVALLRKHDFPKANKQTDFNTFLNQFGLKANFSSVAALRDSLDNILGPKSALDAQTQALIRFKLMLILEQAVYAIVDNKGVANFRHFALNLDQYTHFTSPIRRYPDILVHRLLHKALLDGEKYRENVNKQKMLEIMQKCNDCKTSAKRASQESEKTVALTQLTKSIKKIEVKETENKAEFLKIEFQTESMCEKQQFEFKVDLYLKVIVTSTHRFPIDYLIKISAPDTKDSAKLHFLE